MDRLDALGMVGLALVAAGVWALAGWPWCAVLVGSVLIGLFAVREVRAIVKG